MNYTNWTQISLKNVTHESQMQKAQDPVCYRRGTVQGPGKMAAAMGIFQIWIVAVGTRAQKSDKIPETHLKWICFTIYRYTSMNQLKKKINKRQKISKHGI